MIIAFTGHRPNKLGGYNDNINLMVPFLKRIHTLFKTERPNLIITGMAQGVDIWAATYSLWARIPFEAYVPFEGQEKKWPEQAQKTYYYLLKNASNVKYICDPGYAPWKMQKRNEAMVKDCDRLIALWDGSPGGTGNCVRFAQSINKSIIYIKPLELKTETP